MKSILIALATWFAFANGAAALVVASGQGIIGGVSDPYTQDQFIDLGNGQTGYLIGTGNNPDIPLPIPAPLIATAALTNNLY